MNATRRLRRIMRLGSAVAALVWSAAALAHASPDEQVLRFVREDEQRRVEVLARVAPSVVCIFDTPQRESGGSGVIIDPAGFGLTNFHVVASLLDTRRGVGALNDGNLYPLTVLGIDPGGDIAMFKLSGKDRFETARLGDSDSLRAGQWVAALGNPFLLAEDYAPTITLGVVAGLHRYQYGQGSLLEYADCIQVSTSINPGNSGGPLFDLQGRVVGIVGRASFEERGRINVGLGYAVTINQVRRFLPALRAGRQCEHGTLGATTSLSGEELIFNAVQDLSPAQRAGIELGDRVLTINGRPVRTPNDYNNALAILPAEWPVTIGVRRGGNELTLCTRLERLPLHDAPIYVPDLEVNLGEVRRAFELYERADLKCAPRYASVVARGREMTGGEATSQPDLATVTIGGASASQPASALWREWRELAAPLLGFREVKVGWELGGGDEVDGRLVSVVEQRFGAGQRIRWKFDFDSHELAQVTAGDEQHPEAVVWTPAARAPLGELNWPTVWRRRAADGREAEVRIEELRPTLAASQPATETQP